MLLNRDDSALILVDVQEKLMPKIEHSQKLISCCQWLLRLAQNLNIPIICSEQYPQGLGSTLVTLKTCFNAYAYLEKQSFSCVKAEQFMPIWQSLNKKQVVLIGIETHVCVLQTALDLISAGVGVFVVEDAVGSRYSTDHFCALARLKQAGVQCVSAEMVFFEWLSTAASPEFKTLSQAFLRKD